MKTLLVGIVAILALSAFLVVKQKHTPVTKNIAYGAGEELDHALR